MPIHQNHPPENCFPATLTRIVSVTPLIKSFEFTVSTDFVFQAGQWIDLFVEIENVWQVGGYSMISSPLDTGRFELAIKAATYHPVTKHLHQTLKLGEQVLVSNGQGSCVYQAGMSSEVVCIAAGIGITPLLSMIRYRLAVEGELPLRLLYGASSADEMPFQDELSRLAANNPAFQVDFTLSEKFADWPHHQGRIDFAWLHQLNLPQDALYYFCGSRTFIETLSDDLQQLGIAESRFRVEKWWQ